MRRRPLLRASALLAPALLARPAHAQGAWPDRTVTIIAPFTPGSSSDVVARAMAAPMQAALGKPVVVENRPGGSGEVGARAVIRAAPDGHLLLHAPISTWAVNVALRPNLGYDPVRQLTRIMQTVRTPNVLVVNAREVPAGDLAGIVAWLKREAGRASYSSSGIGSSDHLTMEMFKQATGTEAVHAPFVGSAPAVTAIIAGTVQLSFQNLGTVSPHIRDGRVRAILQTGEARNASLPEVPTAAEAGLPDFAVYSWQALGGPPGLPEPLLRQVHAAAAAALRDPEVSRRLVETGFDVVASTPETFAAFQEAEIARWQRVVRAGNIAAE